MLRGIKLSEEMLCEKLPNGDIVIYNPGGFARPFVITGSALYIFECIQKNVPINTNELTQSSIEKILNIFENEKIILGWQNSDPRISEGKTVRTSRGKQISLWIHTTDLCNLQCEGCYITKGNSVISDETISNIAKYVKHEAKKRNLKVLNLKFAGGEPLIAFDQVEKTVKEVKKVLEPVGVKIRLSLISNGTLITENTARKLKELNFKVMISLNGIGSFNNTRPYINGTSSYGDAVKGIEKLLDLNIKPHIIAVITNESVKGLGLLIDFTAKKGLSLGLSFSRDLNKNRKLKLNATKVSKLVIKELKRITEQPWEKIPRISFNNISFDGKRERVCAAGKSYFAIGTNGSISTCQMTIEEPINYLGNNKGGTANTTIEKNALAKKCIDCTWRYVCANGCQAIAKKSNTIGKTPIMCPIYRQILPHLLIYEGRIIQEAMAQHERRKKHDHSFQLGNTSSAK